MLTTPARTDARMHNPPANHPAKLPFDSLAVSEPLRELVRKADESSVVPEVDELFRNLIVRMRVTGAKVLAVSSALSGEGRSTVSLGLAVAIARDYPEGRVLLVETDFGRPVLAEDFQVQESPGLRDYLEASQPVNLACHRTELPNLDIVTAGAVTGHQGAGLRPGRLRVALQDMRRNYDVVILDTPPVLTNSDALVASALADEVVLVVRAGVTPAKLVKKAVEQLGAEKLHSVVLNGVQTSVPGWLRRLCGL